MRSAMLAGVLLLAACAAPQIQSDPLARLLELIDRRIAISEEVARSKWNSGAPVEDLAREREIIDAIGTQSTAYGVDATLAKAFFQAQLDASKVVQNARLAQWRDSNQPPFENAPDLQRDLRPQLDRLTTELLAALANATPALRAADASMRLSSRATDAAHQSALAPLIKAAQQN